MQKISIEEVYEGIKQKKFIGKRVVLGDIKEDPILEISKDFKCCSRKFRKSMNDYLIDLFGYRDYAYIDDRYIYVSENNYKILKHKLYDLSMLIDFHLN